MDYIQSNSQESLYLKIRDKSENDYTAEKVIKAFEDVADRYGVDKGLLACDLLKAIDRAGEIKSMYGFVSKVSISLVEEDRTKYVKSKAKLNFLDLHLALNENGFTGELWEKLYIDKIIQHCIDEFLVKTEDMALTNRSIVSYLVTNKKTTYNDFIECLQKSKVVKGSNVPYIMLEDSAKRLANELEDLISVNP